MNTEMRRYAWWTDDTVYAFNLMLTGESDWYANCMLMLTANTFKPWQPFVKTSYKMIMSCRSWLLWFVSDLLFWLLLEGRPISLFLYFAKVHYFCLSYNKFILNGILALFWLKKRLLICWTQQKAETKAKACSLNISLYCKRQSNKPQILFNAM